MIEPNSSFNVEGTAFKESFSHKCKLVFLTDGIAVRRLKIHLLVGHFCDQVRFSMRSQLVTLCICFIFGLAATGCKVEKDPVSALNGLVKEYGFIGFQNPMEEAGTGTLIAGRPTAVSYVAHKNDCFPEENIVRHYDESNFNQVHDYVFKGSLGFLTSGTPLISAGLGLQKDHMVHVEISGIVIEYMSSIDVSDWYAESIGDTCKNYLDQVGFIIQSLKTENLKIQIYTKSGTQIGLDPVNIGQYFQFHMGANWAIVDQYTVEVTTPKYIGYQLGRLRKQDDNMVLYRAMTTEDDKYVFEAIGLFWDDEELVDDQKDDIYVYDSPESVDENGIYQD
jgi:hypothetical protein